MSETAGIAITIPQELFGRLLAEAMAQGRALSAYASGRFVEAMTGQVSAAVTSTREFDLARQLKDMTATAAAAKNAAAEAVRARLALERRVHELTAKAMAAPVVDTAEIERLRDDLQAERAKAEAQRRLVDDMARERDVWRTRATDKLMIIAERDGRIALLEAEVQKRTEAPSCMAAVEPASLAPAQIRTIRSFASLGHKAEWIAKQTDLPLAVVKDVLKGVSTPSKRSAT
jgi:hypothetical protein